MKKKDCIGKRFGRLTVVEELAQRGSMRIVLCRCDCGNKKEVYLADLKRGHTKSCTCFQKERLIKHGMKYTPEYNTWNSLKDRCTNINSNHYKNYGGRGITVCEEWNNSFEDFYRDMGKKPFKGAEIDRIDNNKGYYKENCRWSTTKENCRNRRDNYIIEYKGERKCLSEWAEILGMNYMKLWMRLKNGWLIDRALTTF